MTDPTDPNRRPLRSPIRPRPPDEQPAAHPPSHGQDRDEIGTDLPDDPKAAIATLRVKMEAVARAYAAGQINRAQFNAIYGHYNEQRTIIERLLDRNPDSPAWQQVARAGHTGFLMHHFQARPQCLLVYRLGASTPLIISGPQTPNFDEVIPILQAVQALDSRPRNGLARKALDGGRWMVLAVGEFALTIVQFMLEPAPNQLSRVRDLHQDFERANYSALARDTRSLERMVFPQRALVE